MERSEAARTWQKPRTLVPKLSTVFAHEALARLVAIDQLPLEETATATSEDGLRVVVTICKAEPPKPKPPFVPNSVQKQILLALDGRARRSTDLARIIGDRGRLYRKPGGIQELKDQGLVSWHPRLGYYRPDRPPKELA